MVKAGGIKIGTGNTSWTLKKLLFCEIVFYTYIRFYSIFGGIIIALAGEKPTPI